MSASVTLEATTRSFAGESPTPDVEPLHFLVVEQASSRRIALPSVGFLLIGRDADADVRIDDPSVSRRHAKVLVQDGAVRAVDLGSRNGVRVNGVALAGARELSPGDVVSIGDATLLLRGPAPRRAARRSLGADDTAARLEHEVARALEYGRPVGVAVFAGGPDGDAAGDALTPVLRAIDVLGRTHDGDAVVLLPELARDEARAATTVLLEALVRRWPEVRAGVAACPEEGCDADTLLASAREAARGAAPRGGVAEAADQRCSVRLGERTIVLADPAMARLFALIERLAQAELPVLVVGETGVGKEHAAFAVHQGSPRRDGPFVSVNCAAVPESLAESEFFGFEKGAFSGAHAAKPGLFERASGGTLFLDEIGELSLAVQAKLLRALEGGTIARLGEARERRTDARVVAATNRDLAREVEAGRFRRDLFYRLNTAVVLLPPLRERAADVPVLARFFLAAARERAGRGPLAIAPDAMLALARHGWPGNVRELRNAMEYAAATTAGGVVERADLPATVTGEAAADRDGPEETRASSGRATEPPPAAAFRPLAEEIAALERQRMAEALAAAGGVKSHAARLISMPERTFRLKLRQYRLEPERPSDG